MTVQPAERVETDLEVLEGLEFEESIGCETYEHCSAKAVWWAILSCCSSHTPSCDACRRTYLGTARLADRLGCILRCAACHAEVSPTTVRFTPIKP